ncbi:MAG: hypothetical protein SF028_10215 [Candidatus Sumerlaeia bacterium]|nr:hypothetical protein [Candidatus Sumerlaeia bacterium]
MVSKRMERPAERWRRRLVVLAALLVVPIAVGIYLARVASAPTGLGGALRERTARFEEVAERYRSGPATPPSAQTTRSAPPTPSSAAPPTLSLAAAESLAFETVLVASPGAGGSPSATMPVEIPYADSAVQTIRAGDPPLGTAQVLVSALRIFEVPEPAPGMAEVGFPITGESFRGASAEPRTTQPILPRVTDWDRWFAETGAQPVPVEVLCGDVFADFLAASAALEVFGDPWSAAVQAPRELLWRTAQGAAALHAAVGGATGRRGLAELRGELARLHGAMFAAARLHDAAVARELYVRAVLLEADVFRLWDAEVDALHRGIESLNPTDDELEAASVVAGLRAVERQSEYLRAVELGHAEERFREFFLDGLLARASRRLVRGALVSEIERAQVARLEGREGDALAHERRVGRLCKAANARPPVFLDGDRFARFARATGPVFPGALVPMYPSASEAGAMLGMPEALRARLLLELFAERARTGRLPASVPTERMRAILEEPRYSVASYRLEMDSLRRQDSPVSGAGDWNSKEVLTIFTPVAGSEQQRLADWNGAVPEGAGIRSVSISLAPVSMPELRTLVEALRRAEGTP